MARGMPNTYVLVGGLLLFIIGLTQYFTLRSENSHLTIKVQELQRQLKSSSLQSNQAEEERNEISKERDSCSQAKAALEQEKTRLKQEIREGVSIVENSKGQLNQQQNTIDNLNEKLRASEDSEKQAIDLEEESKLKLDEAEKQKAESEQKLQQCLGRESQAFEDLQKLKQIQNQQKNDDETKDVNNQESMNEGPIETAPRALDSSKSNNQTQEIVRKQIIPPKIHFEDEEGLVADKEVPTNTSVEIKKDEEGIDSNIADEEKNLEYDEETVDPLEKEEEYEKLEDPESRKNAQLPNADPSKIKVEQRDMSGNFDGGNDIPELGAYKDDVNDDHAIDEENNIKDLEDIVM